MLFVFVFFFLMFTYLSTIITGGTRSTTTTSRSGRAIGTTLSREASVSLREESSRKPHVSIVASLLHKATLW